MQKKHWANARHVGVAARFAFWPGFARLPLTFMLRNGLYQVRYPIKAYQGFLDRPIERRGLEPDEPLMPTWLLEQGA
jgi:hypothetical protein